MYPNDIVKKIDIERDAIDWSNIKSLMRAEQRIATYNHMIAEKIAPLHRLATSIDNESYFKYRETTLADGKKMSQGDSERAAKVDANDARKEYELCLYVFKGTQDLMISIRRRLKYFENERYGDK